MIHLAGFRIRPVLSVIKEIVENGNIIENFVSLDKAKLFAENMTEAKRNKQAYIDSKQYQANLDKLMDILQTRMDTEFITLYDLYVFSSDIWKCIYLYQCHLLFNAYMAGKIDVCQCSNSGGFYGVTMAI